MDATKSRAPKTGFEGGESGRFQLDRVTGQSRFKIEFARPRDRDSIVWKNVCTCYTENYVDTHRLSKWFWFRLPQEKAFVVLFAAKTRQQQLHKKRCFWITQKCSINQSLDWFSSIKLNLTWWHHSYIIEQQLRLRSHLKAFIENNQIVCCRFALATSHVCISGA